MSDTLYFEQTYTDEFFNVSGDYGFLPIRDPLKTLPSEYNELQKLIDDLHVIQSDGKTGILGIPNEIVKRVNDLPNYLSKVDIEEDVFILQALYRAYTFITSGYTLELAYQEFINSGNYGIARQLIPSNVSEPLVSVSNKLIVYPWLDYHYAYSLGNYVKKDPTGSLDWKNLDMACKFTGSPDEIGFIMIHVYINELSPKLVESVMKYGSVSNIKGIKLCGETMEQLYKRRIKNNHWLKICGETMEQMNKRRREMWTASRHEHYNDFRIFIMGVKGNDKIFGNGLIYDKCFDNKPLQYRGQTGAQDSIIPMMDIFTGIVDYYPENKLTEYLLDLRTYRPMCVQNFFTDLRNYYSANGIYKQLVTDNNYEGLIYLLKIVDEVYLFRNGHWQFVQKYIMSNTKYAFATGGTPITTWLINQIEAVLKYEQVIIDFINKDLSKINNQLINYDMWINLYEGYGRKKQLLLDQVKELENINYDINLVYMKNEQLKLEDDKL
jgi:indoleamine 2,3-dioxygenase